MTLNQILKQGASQFNKAKLYFGHGTDNAWDEAVWIALHVLGLPLDADKSVLKRKLTDSEAEKITNLYQRRVLDRKPVAYLINEAWFADLPFYIDERALIPRSPIAELIRQKFKPWIGVRKVTSILDMCTGSGCIAVACAKAFPKARVVASDISKDALSVAKINLKKHQLEKQLQLIQSDLFKQVPAQKFDIIVSNPPYVDADDMATLPNEYHREPMVALTGGKDGLILVDKILAQAKQYLAPHGILVVEVGNSYKALEKKYPKLSFKWVKFKHGEGEVFVLAAKDL